MTHDRESIADERTVSSAGEHLMATAARIRVRRSGKLRL